MISTINYPTNVSSTNNKTLRKNISLGKSFQKKSLSLSEKITKKLLELYSNLSPIDFHSNNIVTIY